MVRAHISSTHGCHLPEGLGAGGTGWPGCTEAGHRPVFAGDIVDSSADSPPSLKARTHSVSTGRWAHA